MILEREVPLNLQFQPDRMVLDEGIAKAKAALLNDIKRSIYLYRVDCGGCNGCEIEIFSSITPVFDVERFGIKNTPSPRHADILVYTGAMTRSMRMPAVRAYQGAPDPKLVVSYGACGCTGGIFHDNYCVWGGTDKLFPVDVYIPGCPPSPPQTIYGFAIALGLLGQKLHHSELVEGADEQVPFRFEEIPYKMRVAFERKARLYAGYRTGLALAEEFMEALQAEGPAPLEKVDALIARQDDPRLAEVLTQLKAELVSMLDGTDVAPRPLLQAASPSGA